MNSNKKNRGKLRTNFLHIFRGEFIYAISQWLVLSGLTKLTTPEQVGQFGLALGISAPVFLFVSMRIQQIVATDYLEKYKFGEYLGLGILAGLFGLVVVLGICIISRFDVITCVIVFLVSTTKYMEIISCTVYGLIQQHTTTKAIGQAKTIRGLGGMAFFLVGVYSTTQLWVGLALMNIWWMLVLLFFEFSVARRLVDKVMPIVDGRILLILKSSIFLGIVAGLTSLNTNITRYFLTYFHGYSSVGYYSAILYVATGIGMFNVSLGFAVQPTLAEKFHENLPLFKKVFWKYLLINLSLGAICIVGALLFGKLFLRIAYTQEYVQYHFEFVMIMVVCAISMIMSAITMTLTACQKFASQALLFTCAVLLTLVAGWFLISQYKVLGAVLTQLLSTVFIACYSGVLLLRVYLHQNLNRIKSKL